MKYASQYLSPLGIIRITCTEKNLIELKFSDQKNLSNYRKERNKEITIINEVKTWLDDYFSGKNPLCTFPILAEGTAFRQRVWDIVREIPYGKTKTYGEIAHQVAHERNLKSMSAQAIGSAVANNHIALVIPCHRVVGANGQLTGYSGGLERKKKLLWLELGLICF